MLTREAQDVAWLEVAVHPPAAMQLRQPFRNQAKGLHNVYASTRLILPPPAPCKLQNGLRVLRRTGRAWHQTRHCAPLVPVIPKDTLKHT